MPEFVKLPNDAELEREILASCFQEDDHALADTREILSVEDFSMEENQSLFRALCAVADRGDALTANTVYSHLQAAGVQSIGPGKLSDYVLGNYAGWALDKNLARAKQLSTRRRAITAAHILMTALADLNSGVDECLESYRKAIEGADSQTAKSTETVGEIVEAAGGVTKFFEARPGIPTPWVAVNRDTGGWHRGELVLIAARSSMGKTSLALNALYHSVRVGIPSVFYSCEMTQEAITKRLISLITGITFMDLQRGNLDASERRAVTDALGELAELPMRIMNAAGRTISAIRNHAGRLKRKGLCELAFLDYIGLLRGSDRRENRNQELGDICRQLKLTASELNIPVIVLVQLNRALETRTDKRPTMADMRDSGELEEHADLIELLYRPEYYNRQDASLQGLAQLIVAKQRNGPTPTIALRFDHRAGRFSDSEETNG